MADAMIGFGIGLTGTPKDYTGIVAARRRQDVAEQARKKAAKDKEFDPIYKSLIVDDNLYMPYQIPEVNSLVAQGIKDLESAKASENISQAAEVQRRIGQQLTQMAAERKSFDELLKAEQLGKVRIGTPASEFYKLKNRQEAFDLVERTGGDYFRNEIGVIGSNPVESINMEEDVFRPTAKSMTPYQTGEKIELTTPDGKKVFQYKQVYDENEMLSRLASSFDSNPAIKRNALFNYKQRAGDVSKLTPEQLESEAKKQFLESGLTFMNREKYFTVRGKNNLNINIGLGGEKESINQPMATDSVQIGTKRGTINVPVFGSTATGDIVSTFPTSADQFYTDDNEKVSGGAVTKATYNQISVGIVANSDIKIPDDTAFLMDYNIPKSVKEYAGQTIKAGQLVDPELKDYLAERGKLRASVITFGNTEDDSGIYRSASLVQQNNWFKANKQKSPEIEELFNTQRQIEQDLTRMYRKDVTKTPKAPTETPPKQPESQKTPEKPPKKKQNKYGI